MGYSSSWCLIFSLMSQNTILQSDATRALIKLALKEDLPSGDVTTELTECGGVLANAELIAKEELVWCGCGIAELVFEVAESKARVVSSLPNGTKIHTRGKILELEGTLAELLGTERIILNFCQHLSGISTHVRKLVDEFPTLKLLDTRKTLPGYRELEKFAVKIGGALNHRFSLSDQILIKDNHIDGSKKSPAELVLLAKKNRTSALKVEVEIAKFEDLVDVVEANPDIIMLDNMDDELLRRSVKFIQENSEDIKIEISGNINRERLNRLQDLNGCYFSMGSLTYGAKHVDISMNISTTN